MAWAQVEHRRDGAEIRLGDLFDDEAEPEAGLMEIVGREFLESNWMAWGQIPAEWRHGRNLYTLTLPTQGWFVEIGDGATVGVLNRSLPKTLRRLNVESLTLEHLYSGSRELTSTIADWVWGRVLFDRSSPLGVRYSSKFGSNHVCYSIWLRAIDDGKTPDDESTKWIGSQQISDRDPDLWQAAAWLNLRVH